MRNNTFITADTEAEERCCYVNLFSLSSDVDVDLFSLRLAVENG